MASGLVDSADAAAARFPSQEPVGPEEEMQEHQVGDETEPRGVATDESTRAMPALVLQEGGHDESGDEVAETTAAKPDT